MRGLYAIFCTMRFTTVFVAVAAFPFVRGLETESQWPIRVPEQSQKLSPPSRPLEWGDINVIATTDTHGW